MKQVIVVRRDLKLGKGKLCAQVAHASLEAYKLTKRKKPSWVRRWETEGCKKIVVCVGNLEELLDLFEYIKSTLPCVLIKDAGYTQLPPETITCLGIGPVPDDIVDKYTGHLKLL